MNEVGLLWSFNFDCMLAGTILPLKILIGATVIKGVIKT
jgi:hypothetical protein